MPRLRAIFRCCVLAAAISACLAPAASPAWGSPSEYPLIVDFLYDLARDYRKQGDLERALQELDKALLLDPRHAEALNERLDILALLRDRLVTIDAALDALREQEQPVPPAAPPPTRSLPPAPAAPPSTPAAPMTQTVPPTVTRQRRPGAASETLEWMRAELREAQSRISAGVSSLQSGVRSLHAPRVAARLQVPDPAVNGTRWFYVFGPGGRVGYGARPNGQEIFIAVPAGEIEPVVIRIIDADTRGRYDEMDTSWDTVTAFAVYGDGPAPLALRVIGPEEPDDTVVTFGPFRPIQGEIRGEWLVFRVQAQGLSGNDNNLFGMEVTPATAEGFVREASLRLPDRPGAVLRVFPEIPPEAAMVRALNFDLDRDGGRASMVRVRQDGARDGWVPVRGSESGVWVATTVTVPPGTEGTRWVYRIEKGAQREGNAALGVTDAWGTPLPLYFKGRAR